ATPALEFGGKVRLRLDQHTGPAVLLEMPGLRQIFRVVRAHLDEISGAPGEECLLQLVLHVGRKYRAHNAPHASTGGFLRLAGFAGSRERLTSRLVLCPGTRSISTTSPPAASTTS